MPFSDPKYPFILIFFFLVETIIITFINVLALFTVQNLKNSYNGSKSVRMRHFFCPNENFFREPVNEPCFFHSCLSTSYYSISNILTIKEYSNLTGWEPFSAITWEPDFSQACSFCSMLMSHRNYHFTKIPDKTNDVIFLKSSETMFLGHLCPMRIFFHKIWLSHTTIYGLLTPCQVSEKTYEPVPRKTTHRQKNGEILFYRKKTVDTDNCIEVSELIRAWPVCYTFVVSLTSYHSEGRERGASY